MNRSPIDGYVVLAIVIAATALLATTANTVHIVEQFDPSGLSLRTIIGGALGQASIALAMVCAILLAQSLYAQGWKPTRPDPTPTLAPDPDTISDPTG